MRRVPTYVALGKWTQHGIRNIKDLDKRFEDAKKIVKSFRGEVKIVYFTMGQYDWVSVMEFPNDNAAMSALLKFGSGGSARTETLKAFAVEETMEFVKKIL